jgi:hypothetical protein
MEERRRTPERRSAVKAACETVCNTVTKLEGKLDTAISTSDLRINLVEKGVANYVKFQRTVEKFITESETRDEERKRHEEQRARELKEALAEHYQKTAQETANLSLKISQRTFIASLWQVAFAAAAIMVAIYFGVATYKLSQHGGVDPLKLLHSQAAPEYSVSTVPQTAEVSAGIERRF